MLDPPPPPIAHGAIVVILGFSRADVAVAATRSERVTLDGGHPDSQFSDSWLS